MIDFDFVSPTKIYFGKGKENQIGKIAKSHGFCRVLLIFGGKSAIKSGLLQRIEKSLNDEGIEFFEFGGIRPNPIKEDVIRGISEGKRRQIDSIICVGGGSVIDSGKAIGAGFFYDGDPFDFNLKKAVPNKCLPIGVVLTFASAGSEMSNSCVIQDDEAKIKAGFNSDLIRPTFAIENPELSFSVPQYQKACGIADTIMHSLERYFDPSGPYQLCDEWALDLIANVMEAGKKALENPNDYDSHAALMLASSLSHNGLTHIGKPFGFVVHPMEHALSGYNESIVHGAGVALIYPAWASYVCHKDPSKFAYFTKRIFKKEGDNDLETAIIGIDGMKEFFAGIGLPTSLKEVGIQKEDVLPLAKLASGNGTRVIGCYPQSLKQDDIERIFSSLL